MDVVFHSASHSNVCTLTNTVQRRADLDSSDSDDDYDLPQESGQPAQESGYRKGTHIQTFSKDSSGLALKTLYRRAVGALRNGDRQRVGAHP